MITLTLFSRPCIYFQTDILQYAYNNLVTYQPFNKGAFTMKDKLGKDMMNKFKEEVASELGVNLNDENLTAEDAGRVGGEMTRKMVKEYERNHSKLA